jgi:homoserine acetyltransferase
MPFFKAFLVRNDTLNSAPIHELWARYKRVEPYAKSYEFLIKGNEKERAEALKLAKRPEFLIYQKAKESAEAFRNTTNLLHIMANQPNKLFPRLKDESMLDYERRILGQKDAVIQLIIETMIQYAKIENQVLDELEKRLKKMKQ